jgi:hypothetical protein
MCTEPARKAKNADIENNRPNNARIAALNETNCRIIEESFKQDKAKKESRQIKSYSLNRPILL